MKWTRGHKGFSAIELILVVTLMIILAVMAIPNYLSMQLRAKRSELPLNLDSIRNAEKSYEHVFDAFTTCPTTPEAIPGKTARLFGHSHGDNGCWDLMGWLADGKVRASYSVTAIPAENIKQANFSAAAVSDIDGNGLNCTYVGDRHQHPYMLTDNSRY